ELFALISPEITAHIGGPMSLVRLLSTRNRSSRYQPGIQVERGSCTSQLTKPMDERTGSGRFRLRRYPGRIDYCCTERITYSSIFLHPGLTTIRTGCGTEQPSRCAGCGRLWLSSFFSQTSTTETNSHGVRRGYSQF